MKSPLLLVAAIAAVALAPAHVSAQQSPNTVTLAAAPTLVGFGAATVLSGQVTGAGNAGVKVDLQQNPHPFADFKNAGMSTTTDASGNYSFTVKPALLTRYRVTAKAKPQVESPVVEVRVRPLVSLAVNDSSARKGQRVTFSGSVTPAHDGRTVTIQRKIGRGAYRTISTVGLVKSAVAGRSDYSKTLKVTRTATYRVRFAADADHVLGTSRTRRVRVG
jgi:hypothetical protein